MTDKEVHAFNVHIYIHIYIYVNICMCIYMYICMHTYTDMLVCLSISPSIHPSIHPSMYLPIGRKRSKEREREREREREAPKSQSRELRCDPPRLHQVSCTGRLGVLAAIETQDSDSGKTPGLPIVVCGAPKLVFSFTPYLFWDKASGDGTSDV